MISRIRVFVGAGLTATGASNAADTHEAKPSYGRGF